jgi:hypothetical protein
MTSIWKLIYDLEYWIHIQTDDDIVNCPDNRREYQHLVQEFKALKTPVEKIPGKVLIRLKEEADMPWFKRPTTRALIKVAIRGLFRKIIG